MNNLDPHSNLNTDVGNSTRLRSEQWRDSADKALNTSRVYANDVLDKAESKVRELRGSVDPVVDMMASKAQKLARQSLDLAAEAKDRARQSASRAADITQRYVAEQPLRSVLIAAAVGASVALLISVLRSRQDKDRY